MFGQDSKTDQLCLPLSHVPSFFFLFFSLMKALLYLPLWCRNKGILGETMQKRQKREL